MAEFKFEDTASWDARQVRERRSQQQQHPRKKHHRFSWVTYFIVVLVISAILAGVGWLLINDLCSFNKKEATATVEVTSEDTVNSIATKLKDAGLIQYKWFFKLFAGLSNAKDKIGIGTYELNSEMDYRALITSMHNASGNLNQDTVRVTIPEGYTVNQIIALLAENGVNTTEALTEAAQTATFNYSYIDNESEDISRLEGYLFPDTYDFYLNEKASSALNRLVMNFDNKMDEDRMEEVAASPYNIRQIITIASLIEKETDGSDQKEIASVIYNRLNDTKGTHGTYGLLNIDASLLYALPGHEGAITSADLKVDSPYNLYIKEGLPPTPIANPGLVSINAALEPASTSYYYYALGKDGKHHYFATYDEHQAFVKSDQYGG